MLNLKTQLSYKVYLSLLPIFSYDIITSSSYGFYTAAAYRNIPHPLISHTSTPHTFTTSPHDTTPNPISDDQITSPDIPYHTTWDPEYRLEILYLSS